LPAPLKEDVVYYVKSPSGATLQLAESAGGAAIDLTSEGSGTITIYSGYNASTYSGKTALNSVEDISSVSEWSTTSTHNILALCDVDMSNVEGYIQANTLASKGANTVTLGTALARAILPLTMVFLVSRNVRVLANQTSATTDYLFYFPSAANHKAYFVCELRNYGTSGRCLASSYGVTLGGVVYGFNRPAQNARFLTCNGIVIGGYETFYYAYHLVLTEDAVFACCRYLTHTCQNVIMSGLVYAIGYFSYITDTVCYGGKLRRCRYMVNTEGASITFRSTDIAGAFHSGIIPEVNRSLDQMVLRFEHYDQTLDDHRTIQMFGKTMKLACSGIGDGPSADPDAGSDPCLAVYDVETNCSVINPVVLFYFDDYKIWVAAGTYTFTFKVQTTYAGIAAGGLVLKAEYLNSGGLLYATEVEDTTAITTRSSASDWTQTIAVTVTTAVAGFVRLRMELCEYESGNELYVWPTVVIS
jgi:hypothetical protein